MVVYAHGAAASVARVPTDALETGDNVLGALIFYSYMVAALFFTGLIVKDLLSYLPRRDAPSISPGGQKGGKAIAGRGKQARGDDSAPRSLSKIMFPALAFASFSVLSWNMLSFLIVSYHNWTEIRGIRTFAAFGSLAHVRQLTTSIWVWSTDSNLFLSFAEDLLRDSKTWAQVRLSLLHALVWNVWMSILGHRAGTNSLWAYFVLGQILPTSFAQNLFLTALSLAPSRQGATPKPALLVRSMVWITYAVMFWIVPRIKSTPWFLPAIFVLRILLFAPFVVDHFAMDSTRNRYLRLDQISQAHAILGTGLCVVFALYQITAPSGTVLASRGSTGSNYAAKALTDDVLLGILSGTVFVADSLFGARYAG